VRQRSVEHRQELFFLVTSLFNNFQYSTNVTLGFLHLLVTEQKLDEVLSVFYFALVSLFDLLIFVFVLLNDEFVLL
jgi:hypothetical protein